MKQKKKDNYSYIILGLIAVFITLLFVSNLLPNKDSSASIDSEVNISESEQNELENLFLENGNEITPIKGELLNGDSFNYSDYKGKKMIVNFFMSSCSACQEEVPMLDELNKKHNDFEVLFVNLTSQDDKKDVEKFVKELNIKSPVILNDEISLIEDYKIMATPTTLLLDEEGKLIDTVIGNSTETDIDLLKLLK